MKVFLLWVAFLGSLYGDEINWQASPDVLSTMGVDASFPKVAMDAEGNVLAAWIENGSILARTKPPGGTWNAPSTVTVSGASSLRLVVDLNGNATAIWLEGGSVKASSMPKNGSWSSSANVSSTSATSPQIAVDDGGNVVAVWERNGNVESATKMFGGQWPSFVDTILSNSAKSPQVAIGGNGIVMAIWTGMNGMSKAVYTSTQSIGGAWSLETRISTLNQDSGYPSVAIDSNGNALAAWIRWDVSGSVYSNVICQAATKPENGSWSTPIDISKAGVRIPGHVRVLFDQSGNAVVFWSLSFDGSTYALQFASKSEGGIWDTPVDLILENWASCNLDVVKIIGDGCRAIFLNFQQDRFDIQTTVIPLSGYFKYFWSPIHVLSQGGNNGYPKAASAINGNTIHGAAIWVHYNGSNTVIQAVTGTGTTLAAPQNLSVVQSLINYDVFKTYENTFSWHPVSNASGYYVFRNGVLVEAISATVTNYLDRNQNLNETVTYGVASIDGNNRQSPTASIVFPPGE